MATETAFLGTVSKGRFVPDEPCLFRQALEGRRVAATIHRPKRSNRENRYYWKVVVKGMARGWGYFPWESERVHSAIKLMFLTTQEEGKPPEIRSTADLTTVEFEELMSRIRSYAAVELGELIRKPNEVMFDERGNVYNVS